MNQDEIIEMAIKTNILEQIELLDSNQWRQDKIRELEAFAKLVAAKERKACANLCENMALYTGIDCADAIRARGEA